ncbi:unnamed protein product [Heligmosomoides polygyrus]|uniref:Pep_M12B_propep domain-containing protein n=1 Tax=Heligmosomoides polygyrus TaxID=6339 RepID=A0A183G2W6_HELPZ|nr:unnamed protein product [Heligmosomoides polygyrus]
MFEGPIEDILVIARDLSGHDGIEKNQYPCHGGFAYSSRNEDGIQILEHAETQDRIVVNTCLEMRTGYHLQQ